MQTLPADQLVGKTFKGYLVKRLLGQGKLSAVYEALDEGQGHTVTITTFFTPSSMPEQAREQFITRFLQEGATLVRLTHPNILPIYGAGEQYGYPYLITPLFKGNSLAKVLKQQGRFSPEETLPLLKPIAAALGYAHSQGIVHGSFSPANVLLNDDIGVQVAGFGFVRLLRLEGIDKVNHPSAHLLSVAGTFLGDPAYVAPETVLGAPIEPAADIYALGVVLTELLSGTQPFAGSNPFEIARMHTLEQMPTLSTLRPDLPIGLDIVVHSMLEPDPAQRTKSVNDVVVEFEHVLKLLHTTAEDSTSISSELKKAEAFDPQITLPPTVNWLDEDALLQGKSLSQPLLPAAKGLPTQAAVPNPQVGQEANAAPDQAGSWQLLPPIITGKVPAIPSTWANVSSAAPQASPFYSQVEPQPGMVSAPSDGAGNGVDPFAWWSATSELQAGQLGQAGQTGGPGGGQPGTFNPTTRPLGPNQRRQSANKQRRRVVALVAGGVVAAGVVGVGGVSLAHMFPKKAPQTSVAVQPSSSPTKSMPASAPSPTATPKPKPSPTATPAPAPTQAQAAQPTPTQAAQPTPTQAPPTPTPTMPPPTPTPVPPQHTGTVVGSTGQAPNSSKGFTNPADGAASLLIHLPGGNFVAYESACTHEGVTCYYDSGMQKIVCPRHNGIYDPANGASVVSGPPPRPLPAVNVRVNADGTVTTG